MSETNAASRVVVVVGAGPAGTFLAGRFAKEGAQVILINRDIKPGGLVEFGIFPTRYKLKGGVRRQMAKLLALPNVHYMGNVSVGEGDNLTLAELRALKPSALVITTGAQGTKFLGIKGEKRTGVHHAKDLVYHYTQLPPYATRDYPIGKRALIIGMGNVAIDITHWLVHIKGIEEVTIMARRGPAERKYTSKEVACFAANFDREDLGAEIERVRDSLVAIGQDPDSIRAEIHAELDKKPQAKTSETVVRYRFLQSPVEFLGQGQDGKVDRVRIEKNRLVADGDRTRCVGTGEFEELAFDSAIFAVGDRVDDGIGLPYKGGRYLTAEGEAGEDAGLDKYRLQHTESGEILEEVFVAGWSRRPSEGLVGIAKHDGIAGAELILEWLAERPKDPDAFARVQSGIEARLKEQGVRVATQASIAALDKEEARVCAEQGKEEHRFPTNEETFAAIDRGLASGA